MGTIKSYHDLIVWQKAMGLAEQVHGLAQSWPRDELYGMISQIRRAALSVAANVAEGHGRWSTREYAHFLSIARGSLMETETTLLFALRLKYLTPESAQPSLNTIAEVGKMLNTLHARLGNMEARK